MPKMFIANIGYTEYAVSTDDAVALVGIISRLRKVKQNGYQVPYIFQDGDPDVLSHLTFANCEEPEPTLAITHQPLAIADETGGLF